MTKHVPASTAPREPRGEKELLFCKVWLRTHDAQQAWLEAGYKNAGIKRRDHVRKLAALQPYIERHQSAIAKEVAKRFVLDQQGILDEMIAVGFANPQDYIEEVQEQVIEMTEEGPVAKLVTKQLRKNIMKLTRAQAAAVTEIDFHPDGTVSYRLPDADAKHPFLKDLGQHLGLFHPKLIQEHRHRHMHAHIDMRDVDQGALVKAEEQLLKALGSRGNLLLGVQPSAEDEES